MKIAIIGTGNVGAAVGQGWGTKGHEVVFGVRDPKSPKAQAAAKAAGARAKAAGVKEAATAGEVVVLAAPFTAAQEALRSAGDLAGKILIDATNPVKGDLSGLAVGLTDSAGEQVARWARGAKVVKGFNTIG